MAYRSSLTRWRQRMGEEKLKALLQESLAVDDDPPDRRAGADSNELREFEDRIRSRLPNLQNLGEPTARAR